MRDDMHEDMVFLMHTYVKLVAANQKGKALKKEVKREIDERIPGNTIVNMDYFMSYILDCGLVALWPWRTAIIATNPRSFGGKHANLHFNEKRLEVFCRES